MAPRMRVTSLTPRRITAAPAAGKWPGLVRSPPDVLRQPREHFLVPQPRVLRLEHPMVLVREIHQPRRHAFLPQRVVKLEPLRHRDTKVLLAVQDERRRLEIGGESLSTLAVDLVEVPPRRRAQRPL